jgi:hypothetical protein
MKIYSINRCKFGIIISLLSLRDPVRVVFPHWVEAISTIVDEIATQKRPKILVKIRIDCLQQLVGRLPAQVARLSAQGHQPK